MVGANASILEVSPADAIALSWAFPSACMVYSWPCLYRPQLSLFLLIPAHLPVPAQAYLLVHLLALVPRPFPLPGKFLAIWGQHRDVMVKRVAGRWQEIDGRQQMNLVL